MRFCYQVATPDVEVSKKVTAYQGPLERSLERLQAIGYDGAEFMTVDPKRLNWEEVKSILNQTNMAATLVCTGEIFGQMGLSFTDPDAGVREEALSRLEDIIDFAGAIGANINIGRVRGRYHDDIMPEQTEEWAVEACQRLSDYGKEKNTYIALEEVCFEETNFLNSLEQAMTFIKRIGRSNFKLMMDVFHMHIEEKSMEDSLRRYAGETINIHLTDSNRRYPGQGGLNFDSIIRTCAESGYEGPFCTEIFQYPDMETAAVKSYEYLAPLFEKYYGRKSRI